MIEFKNGVDERTRQPRIQVAIFWIDGKTKGYCVIGTPYGIHRKRNGDVKAWLSKSSAYRWIKNNKGFI
jgi:hypothetical protein